jgi:hypothetical protein
VRLHIHHFGLVPIVIALTIASAQQHSFTVKDDIEMVRFSDPSAPRDADIAKLSPDGRYFALVTSKGIIKTDGIESTISIYNTAECRAFVTSSTAGIPPRPREQFTMTAALTTEQQSAYGAVITNLRWSSDSRGIYFLAEAAGRERRLYRMNLTDKRARPLSARGYHVERFDFAKDVVVYSAWRSSAEPIAEDESDRINADARAVTGEAIESILFPPNQFSPTIRELWVVRTHRGHLVARRLSAASQLDSSLLSETFAVSPDGQMLAQLQPILHVPVAWTLYEPAKDFQYRRIPKEDPSITAPDNLFRLKEYSLVNLESGKIVEAVHAPHDFPLAYTHENEAIWSSDGKHVLLTNTFLPLDGASEIEHKRRLQPCAIAEITLPSRKLSCIVFVADLLVEGITSVVPKSLSFSATTTQILFQVKLARGGLEVKKYTFAHDTWREVNPDTSGPKGMDSQSKDVASASDLEISVRQSLNEAPVLWLADKRTGQSKPLWNPNPQFGHLQFGSASVYHWRDKNNNEWKGGLVTPVGYIPGRRYPLVIQVYGFNDSEFLTDGSFPTAFAARELASDGIVALQIPRRIPHGLDLAAATDELAGIESAIDQLENEGLVDSHRVGLVGFSASCWYVEYAMINAPLRFAAATLADGIDMSYMQYRLWGVSSPNIEQESENLIGAKPVGVGLKRWIELAPGFHLDRVKTPLRIETITSISILGEWEIYSSLKQQKKPVDLIYFPDGQHIHQKPLERLASQQGDVDWFRFWLQDYEDPDPSKRVEYRRWREMRALQGLERD